MCWKDKKLCKRVSGPTPKWSSSTRARYLTTWNQIFSFNRISACSCWQMLTCIQRMAGHSFLEWRSRVGEFAFKATRDIIRISHMTTNLLGISHLRLQEKFSIEPSRLLATSLPTSSQSDTVRPMNALWMARHNWKKLTRNPLLYALYAFEKCHRTSASTVKNWNFTLSLKMFLS